MAAQRDKTLVQALCAELATAIGGLLGVPSSAAPGGQPPSDGFQIRYGIGGRGTGTLWLGISSADAGVITRRILGVEHEEPAEGTLRDTIRELAAQTGKGLETSPVGEGVDVAIQSVEPSFSGVPAQRPTAWTLTLGDELTMVVAAWSAVTLQDRPAPLPPGSENLDMILDIDLPMAVRFGRTELALGALTRLGPGSIIDLGRSPDEPVEVLVSGRVVAHGDVVVVGGNYGVRITDVVTTAGPVVD